jgi:hypothetical protein
MQIDVTLAGHTSSWRFQGSTEFASWLRDRIAQNDGGVKVCRVAACELLPEFSTTVRRLVYAYDEGRSALRVHLVGRIKPSLAVRELEDHLLARLQINTGFTEYKRLVAAGRSFEERLTVFVVEAAGIPAASLLETARDFIERIEKTGGNRLPTIVIVAVLPDSDGLSNDFTVGVPVDPVLSTEVNTLAGIWRRYVHHRLAWEAGGHILRARVSSEQHGCAKVPTGSDDLLERLLNDAAQAHLEHIDEGTQEKILELVVHSGDETKTQEALTKYNTELLDKGLLWFGPGSGLLRPTPWAARALLLGQCPEPARYVLRSCLVCAPLAREILIACFDLEAQERALCCLHLPPNNHASAQAQDGFNGFCNGNADSVAPHYPAACPARPHSVWCFAGFGEILQNARCPGDSYRHRLRHMLRRLRNTLSHGHYLGWQAVQTIYRLKSDLELRE